MSSLPIDWIIDLRNKIQCERIDQLIDPLERLEHASSTILRDETRPILDKLFQCIDDCNNYIEKLKPPDQWYEEIYEEKKVKKN
jgi:hypothetical protein